MILPRSALSGLRDALPDLRSVSAFAFTAAVLIAVPFCGGGGPPGLSPVTDRARLYYNDAGGVADSTRQVIRDVDHWRQAWDQATARQDDPPPLPAVDFDESMVLLVAAGRSAPGDRIRVDSVGVTEQRTAGGDTRDVLKVVVRKVRACGDFQGETFPVEIVRVRTYDGPVTFAERTVQGPGCQQGAALSRPAGQPLVLGPVPPPVGSSPQQPPPRPTGP